MRSKSENIQKFNGDIPVPRFGHTITYYTQSKLCLFGGATISQQIMMMLDSLYSLDMESRQWRKIQSTGVIPCSRAAHAATKVQNNRIVVFGGATNCGLASDQLYMCDIKQGVGIWNIVNVKHKTPGKRHGHTLSFSYNNFILFGGRTNQKVINDLWILNIQKKPLAWCQVKCKRQIPQPRYYHSAALCNSDPAKGMIVIFGGKDQNKHVFNDCWGLTYHYSTGQWDWLRAPNKNQQNLTPRCQHTALFKQKMMFVIGGKNFENQELPMQIFNLQNNQWQSFKIQSSARHASWIYDTKLFNLGGINQKTKSLYQNAFQVDLIKLLSSKKQLLSQIQKNSLKSSKVSDTSTISNYSTNIKSSTHSNSSSLQKRQLSPVFDRKGKNIVQSKVCIDKIESIQNIKQKKMTIKQINDQGSKRKIVMLNPIYGDKKSRTSKQTQLNKKLTTKGELAMFFLSKLMNPCLHKINQINIQTEQIIYLCDAVEQIFASQPMVLHARAPLKIFGDIHGQFSDLMQFFNLYGSPYSTNQKSKSDIQNYDYIFLGDYVDRGNYSVQTICLLFALKVLHPNSVHLLRGNHEDIHVNNQFGFSEQCAVKFDQQPNSPNSVYMRINQVFQWMPLAAVAEEKILCVHGGIGKALNKVEQILQIKRPLQVINEGLNLQAQLTLDILWSDPTENDSVLGVMPNENRDLLKTGNIVKYGPDRVKSFLKDNNLQMIVRAHQCVQDGFERFAGGSLITVFSATDYCGKHKNAGAILLLKTNLEIIPKVIYPKQKKVNTWMQQDQNINNQTRRCSTPPRWKSNK